MILASQNIITGQDASLPLLLATFTPTISGEYFASVNLSLLAGTGVYRFVTTRQIGGTGVIYQSGTSAIGVSAGVTTLTISTIPTPLLAGDILKVYVQGLAGDTAIDGVTEIFRSDTIEELDIIGEKVDGVLNKLNVSSVEFVTAVVGTTITILRGDTLSARLLDLGDFTGYTSIDFTIKRMAGELDDAAKIRLRKNASGADDGLLRLNGAEHTSPTDGSIVIDDLTTGDIEIRLNANATSELVPGNYVYDIQIITANEVRTLTAGKLEVVADVTRATA